MDKSYRERRLAKAERLREWAEKREAKAATVFAAGEPYRSDYAFNTQPGHIPERARLIAREDRAHESIAKAEDFQSRANSIEAAADAAIYSDDEDAVERLEERIAFLEAQRDRIKAYNASCRKGSPDTSLLDEHQRKEIARALSTWAFQCPDGAFPKYHLANLSGNISRQRKRLAELCGH